jgi:hypothetical protein
VVPSKGSLPPGPPHGVPSERDAPFLESSLNHHSKSKCMIEYCCILLKRWQLAFKRCKEYLNIHEGSWEKTYRSCQKHESPLLYDVVSPFYNKPDVKFIHISNHKEHYRKHLYYSPPPPKKNTMPFSTIFLTGVLGLLPTNKERSPSFGANHCEGLLQTIVSICINLKLTFSWEVVGI